MADVRHHSFFLEGPAGRLEALLWTVATPNPESVALVCHPHPLFGGTMHNKVVYQATKTLQAAGMPVLRFNFRGAGLSEGVHNDGIGEKGDVRAALDYLAQEYSGARILLAGFSFGAAVGLRVANEDDRVTRLIGLGIPVAKSDMRFLRDCTKPKLFVSGSEDEFAPLDSLERVFYILPDPKRLRIIPGADHFFTGYLPLVGEEIEIWMREYPH